MTTNQENLKHVEVLRKLLDIWRDNQIDESEIQQEIDALNAAIKALEAERWISVEERLPETSGYLLCACASEFLDHSRNPPFCAWFRAKDKHWQSINRITHWMPLPEGPK